MRETRVIPGSTGYYTKRRSRARITVIYGTGIPGHCMFVIPGALYVRHSWALIHCFSCGLLACGIHEVAGWDVGHVFTSGDFRATVRSHYPLARPHAVPGVRGSNGCRLMPGEKSPSLGRSHQSAVLRESRIR